MENEKGKRRTIWLSHELDDKAEDIRKKLGLSHSGFYRFCVLEIVKQFGISEEIAKDDCLKELPNMTDADKVTVDRKAILICPKCGHGFQYYAKGERRIECLLCQKNLYSLYPRITLLLTSETYKKPKKIGVICPECAMEIGISFETESEENG